MQFDFGLDLRHGVLHRAVRLAIAGISFVAAAGCTHLPEKPAYSRSEPAALRRYDDDWFDAARVGRIDILQALLEAGYPIDAADSHGYTAVTLAAYDGQSSALDFLLASGADPCMRDHHGNTALMGALFKGESKIARRLVDAGCPVDEQNNAGETALDFATLFGRAEFIPLLVARGADPNHVDARGQTPLQLALTQRDEAIADALRQSGATR
jgi:ankyrin repeat protein